MIERCNTYLIGTSEGIYASPHIMKLQDDQAYDPSLIDDTKDRFYDYLKGGVKAPPATIRLVRSALMPLPHPDIDPVPVAGGDSRMSWVHHSSGRRVGAVQEAQMNAEDE